MVPDGRWPQAVRNTNPLEEDIVNAQRHDIEEDERDVAKQDPQEERGTEVCRKKTKREASHLKGRRVLELQDMEYEIGVVDI